MTGERIGIPSVGVMTSKFASAAELMARVLGADRFPFVVIDHPLSSATDDDLSKRARRAVKDGVELLLALPLPASP